MEAEQHVECLGERSMEGEGVGGDGKEIGAPYGVQPVLGPRAYTQQAMGSHRGFLRRRVA